MTVLVAWLVTGEPKLSLGIGLLDSVLKIGAFYVHERIWNRLKFGVVKAPEYEI